MKAIVAVSNEWGIGYKNELLFHIPEDMKYFKELTIHNVVIMGRKTFESLPDRKPLKDRINIVITSSGNGLGDVITTDFHGLSNILNLYSSKKCFVIGGESIYSQLLKECDTVFVTKVFKSVRFDKRFVNLDNLSDWRCIEQSAVKDFNGLKYQFCIYNKICFTG